jgi:hypothetical protein
MATAEPWGEVMRNAYHVTLPARLTDNVRRGSEILGSFGKESSPFLFAELYRVSAMKARGQETAVLAPQVIPPNEVLCFGRANKYCSVDRQWCNRLLVNRRRCGTLNEREGA